MQISYVIHLYTRNSVQAHSAATNKDITSYFHCIYNFHINKIVYTGGPVDKHLQSAILLDPKVWEVYIESMHIPDGEF